MALLDRSSDLDMRQPCGNTNSNENAATEGATAREMGLLLSEAQRRCVAVVHCVVVPEGIFALPVDDNNIG